MLLPAWQHLVSDTAGRRSWEPLKTAHGWHPVICREGKWWPSWQAVEDVSTMPEARATV